MQFREQGQKIQCVRATYDTEAKRTHQKVVASFTRHTDSVPDTGLELLDAKELKQLAAWLQDRKEARELANGKDQVSWAPGVLASLARSITLVGVDNDQAAKILASLDEVKKAIKKTLDAKTVKPPRKTKAKSKPPVVDPRQQPLLGSEPAATTP